MRGSLARALGACVCALALAACPAAAQNIIEIDKLLADDGNVADLFGVSVAVSGDTAVIGAPDDEGNTAGAAYVYTFNGTSWTQQQKITSNDADLRDDFGHSVDIEGDTIVVGALRDDQLGNDAGAAYVFIRNGNTWSQQAKLLPNDGLTGGNGVGDAVAISGNTVIVGMRFGANQGGLGRAYVFVRSGSNWSQQAILTANDDTLESRFGSDVGISGDIAIVGAPEHQHAGTLLSSACCDQLVPLRTNM